MKIELENAVVYQGSNLDVLPTLPDNSVDSIVTDPPYELGFMGKSWDNSGIAYSVELWTECMRVLKPGGHLLAFGGSRTWHRLAVAIEDAGFEMRDSIAWLYGSGFPKSMDISKQIDKRGGVVAEHTQFALELQEAKNKTSLTIADLNEVLGRRTSNLWSHFVGDVQSQLPTTENYWKLKAVLPISDKWDSLFKKEAEREVIGSKMSGIANKEEKDRHTIGASKAVEVDITAPSTPEAQKWQGWGTALKPAFEPVVVARKPLEEKTVAANVLKYGTGGLNIDGSRITASDGVPVFDKKGEKSVSAYGDGLNGGARTGEISHTGRWPANIILDPYTAELLDEQSGTIKGMIGRKKEKGFRFNVAEGGQEQAFSGGISDTGGASRFFYVAKASKKDRNEGLDELPVASSAELVDRQEGSAGMNSPRAGAGRTSGSANIHPTVKPTSLMEYLIKLVTPPNGTVLDPFTGSGSTGKAALLSGFKFIGIELTEEYLPIIEGRLKWASEQVSKETSEVLF